MLTFTHEFIYRRGYADQEIEAMFAKYDMDGDRQLDSEEQKVMQNDLDGQKVYTCLHKRSAIMDPSYRITVSPLLHHLILLLQHHLPLLHHCLSLLYKYLPFLP